MRTIGDPSGLRDAIGGIRTLRRHAGIEHAFRRGKGAGFVPPILTHEHVIVRCVKGAKRKFLSVLDVTRLGRPAEHEGDDGIGAAERNSRRYGIHQRGQREGEGRTVDAHARNPVAVIEEHERCRRGVREWNVSALLKHLHPLSERVKRCGWSGVHAGSAAEGPERRRRSRKCLYRPPKEKFQRWSGLSSQIARRSARGMFTKT